MPAESLNITLIQPEIFWEDRDANLKQYAEMINGIQEKKEVIVLPEMFPTGFSMRPEALAETMDGPTVQWMREICRKQRCILTGSIIIEEEGNYFNRMFWMQPDGIFGTYDKRHLFAFAGEDEHYTAGEKRFIASVKGWKIYLQVCYDLRFPVWARNQPDNPYDVFINVANWPQKRSLAWKTLLQARAIENQCYAVGVNRVGTDGNGYFYSGDSSVFGPLGETIFQETEKVCIQTISLSRKPLEEARNHFPFLKDADSFLIL